MDQDAARRGLSAMIYSIGIFLGALIVIAAIFYHIKTDADTTDIQRCGVKDYGGVAFLWSISIFVPLPVYLILRGFIFARGPLPFLISAFLMGAVFIGDYWFEQAHSAVWQNNFYRSEFCTVMRSLFPHK
ncbi:MAG: hypothetical protein GC182_20730 [Rhodopseudomonas sp.]|nr:hypothetical protein [Rhodopseudomonas sp.]